MGVANFFAGDGETITDVVGAEVFPAESSDGMSEKHFPGSGPISPAEVEAVGGEAVVIEAVPDDGGDGEDEDGEADPEPSFGLAGDWAVPFPEDG